MAAGTGGHVFPALAVAKQLQQQGYKVSWLATRTGMENRLLQNENIQLFQIDIQGVRGNGIVRKLLAPFKILKAMLATRKFMQQNGVTVVAGFGGYVAGPGGLAAKTLGVPVLIHEQNAIAGFTNLKLSKVAKIVCQAFPNTFEASDKLKTTGNPVRNEISQLASPEQRYGKREQDNAPLQILVVGGSLGAQVLNKTVPEALKKLNVNVKVFHQCGQQQLEETQALYANATNVQATVQPFISDMAEAYSQADLVICRAGALTVTEIATAGVAAVFVPLPTAVDDHQTANAQYLVQHDAAKICHQKEMTVDSLYEVLLPLMNRQVLAEMAIRAKKQAQPEATAIVADLVDGLSL